MMCFHRSRVACVRDASLATFLGFHQVIHLLLNIRQFLESPQPIQSAPRRFRWIRRWPVSRCNTQFHYLDRPFLCSELDQSCLTRVSGYQNFVPRHMTFSNVIAVLFVLATYWI